MRDLDTLVEVVMLSDGCADLSRQEALNLVVSIRTRIGDELREVAREGNYWAWPAYSYIAGWTHFADGHGSMSPTPGQMEALDRVPEDTGERDQLDGHNEMPLP